MDTVYNLKLENPKNKANVISKLFFIWMAELCRKGTRKGLEVIDLYKTLTSDKSQSLTDALQKNWDEEVAKSKLDTGPSLTRAIIKTFFWKYMGFGILLFLQLTLFRSLQPFVLGYFINLFSDHTSDQNQVYIFGAILVLQSFCMVICMHHVEFGEASVGMRVRIAASSLIYRKMLKLNKKSLGQTAAGQVVNLLSNDVNRFDFIVLALHYLWIMPFQIVLVTYLIWIEMGFSTLAGVLFMMCLTLPVQGYLAKLTSKLRLNTALRTDYRVKLMNEVISGIQIIKMYAWEKPFEQIVKIARKKEIRVIRKASYLRGVYMSCMVFIERATLFLTITCYVLLGNPITPDKVFSIAQYFNVLQFALTICFPMAITFGAETLVSIRRLREFLLLEEKSEASLEIVSNRDIIFKNVDASWSSDTLTIKNFNLHIPNGTLCAIVGPVGSGKSSILEMLLGELPAKTGSIKIGGSMSYASQEPWLFASTVRNNILFGRTYDRTFYKRIVKICALEKDFQQFPQGDMTVVGEKGVSLSGGQRARINLARAVYKNSDIYLLDDPLSAVDTHVSKHLFEECILKYLRDKTRILVTHQLQYLKQADYIVVVNESVTSGTSEIFEKVENIEEMNHSNNSPFRDYVRASGSICKIIALVSILLLGQIACNCSDLWVTLWTEHEAIRNSNITFRVKTQTFYTNSTSVGYFRAITETLLTDNDRMVNLIKTEFFMYFYAGIILVAISLTLMRSFAFFKMAMTASTNLHNLMFHSLLQAPMRFFDFNPSGRVLNRFSKDMGAIDEFLPRVLMDAVQILLVMAGILVMIIIANYYMTIAILVIGGLFFKVRGWYVATAKDVKHLEGITKSNVFSHLNSSFNGITTIRASQAENILSEEFDMHQDTHTSAWFLTIATRVCFGLWLDLLSVTFIATIIIGFIVLNQLSSISGSFVGLAISQSLILTGMLQYGMRQTAEVVNQLTSVERVMQYTKLDKEQQNEKVIELKSPWPNKGCIEFRNLSLYYSESDSPVLTNLNFLIDAGYKIGIVGRTGAGKSSLISALFRLTLVKGEIIIDGVNIQNVALSHLRKMISIIPQEPVLFSATLRYNLDPFQEFEDEKLWNVLEQVELKENINSLRDQVSEGGSNFSLGQRQLLCLARALLRNNKILVLDEATANVDPRTDSLIQNTIRKNFQNCTVLTIAHRLNTIMDSDKVLVMDAGSMLEFDHPYKLLQNPEGYFTKMVAETGSAMSQQLKQAAQLSYDLVK